MKILIAGAGIGGLYAAYLFGSRGHAVTVYERAAALDEMRYDWHDDVNPSVFTRLGLQMPSESFPKKDWTFVSPCGNTLLMKQKPDNIDYSIERRPLNAYLFGLARTVADVVFGAEVKGAICEGSAVKGLRVMTEGKELNVEADLVVDSCGVASAVRESLTEKTGVREKVSHGDIFAAYRAFYESVPDAKIEYTNKVYMKHLGEAGISWCIMDNDASVNVLVGRIGELNKETLERALAHLKSDNPVIGEKIKRGGGIHLIPVRRPLTVTIADGYAAIGDAACMTVPMIGSGIATSLLAARYLFDAARESETADAATLWKYQVACYKDFGAQHCGVDYMKNWLLLRKDDEIDWLFGSGILTNEDLQGASVGEMVKLSPSDMMRKLRVGINKLPLLVKMGNMLSKAQAAAAVAAGIPEAYDRDAVGKWEAELNKYFK